MRPPSRFGPVHIALKIKVYIELWAEHGELPVSVADEFRKLKTLLTKVC